MYPYLSVFDDESLNFQKDLNILLEGHSEEERKAWINHIESNCSMDIREEDFDLKTGNIVYITSPSGNISSKSDTMLSLDLTQESESFFEFGKEFDSKYFKRYAVLVLDNSLSMKGQALNSLKKSAIKFCKFVLNSNCQNYISIVTYDSFSKVVSEFTNDYDRLKKSINNIKLGNFTNINSGLENADTLLKNIGNSKDIIKSILLLSDGMPNCGAYDYLGKYNYNDYYNYKYANIVYNTIRNLKNYYCIYSLGFFHRLYGRELSFARKFMYDIQNSGYYDVVNYKDLDFVFGKISENIVKKRTGIFTFPSEDKEDFQAKYFYDDEYFSKNASQYNPSLATMSLCFELSASRSNFGGKLNYLNKSKNAKDLLKQIGFDEKNIKTNHYFTIKPKENSVAVIIGSKDIKVNNKKYTLIALAISGYGYEAEWVGNFTIGSNGQHQGFKEASDEAYKTLSTYIEKHKYEFQKNVKFWFAGYSRGGIAVNLLAARLNDEKNISGIEVNKEDLYAYCFEPPNGALIDDIRMKNDYTNIHNIVNLNDILTKVAPIYEGWGFGRYGIDECVIPTSSTSKNYKLESEKMLKNFKALNTPCVKKSIVLVNGKEKHIIDTFQAKKLNLKLDLDIGEFKISENNFNLSFIEFDLPSEKCEYEFQLDFNLFKNDNRSMDIFLNDIVYSISKGFKNRNFYEENLQKCFRLAIAQTLGGGYESYKWKNAIEIFKEKISSDIWKIGSVYIRYGEKESENLIIEYFYKSLDEAKIDIKAYIDIPNSILAAIQAIIRAIISSISKSGFNDIITLTDNFDKIFPSHYPELCLAWLQSQDKNYTPDGKELFVIKSYRVVRINFPIDASVYDSNGILVAQIINDLPQKIEESTIISSFNADGEKLFYLPADESYNIELLGKEDGNLNYSVNEFSYDTNSYTKIVNYNDVKIKKGEVLTALIPKYDEEDKNYTSEGSKTIYTLSDKNENLRTIEELSGELARGAVYSLYLENDNPDGGNIIGGGVYILGSFAKVTAITYKDYKFDGWYTDDMLISKIENYRFMMQKETKLLAKFIKK